MARILVVEDDADILALVVRRLRHAGHRVQDAADGEAAVVLVEDKGVPDAVVLDVNMPGMDGLSLLKQLRKQTDHPDLPAVFLSGRILRDDIAAGRALGAFYLTKPFNGKALLAAVESVLAPTRAAAPTDW